MKHSKLALSLVSLLAIGSTAPVMAEDSLSANIGVASNYVWRGLTQTDGGAAVSGGVDYSHGSGFYLGTWVSNVDFGDDTNYEWDIYAGYGGEVGDISYDLNTIYYAYPDGEDLDFWELGGSVSYSVATVGLQYTIDKDVGDSGDIYYYGGLAFDLPQEFGLGLTLGHYDFEESGDYTHWQVSLSKDAGDFGEFSLNYDDTDVDDSDEVLWVGWSKEF
jgi:uncharacterized protein (TIGR02001 family)